MTHKTGSDDAQQRRKNHLLHEPAKREASSSLVPASRKITTPSLPGTFELSDQHAATSFGDLIDILSRQWWKLAAFVLLVLAATVVVTFLLTPLYESTVAINVERRGIGVLGKDASAPSVGEMDQILMTQVELIKSDPVLRPVAEKYHLLELEHQFRRAHTDDQKRHQNAKTVLKQLKVTRAPNTSILRVSYRAPDPALAAEIVTTIASSYIQHAFDSREQSDATVLNDAGKQLQHLKEKMIVSDGALAAFSRDLGFVDPEQRVNALSARLLQLSSDYTAAQSDRIHKQSLFDLSKSGTLAGAQVSNQGPLLDSAISRLNQSKSDFAKVATIFGEGHPEYQKNQREIKEIQRQFDEIRSNLADRAAADFHQSEDRERMARELLTSTKAEVDGLTAKAFEYQRLKNESENYRKLYDDLERITREQVINRGFQDAILQVVDPARPSAKQASPKLWINLAVAFVSALMLGLGGVLLIDAVDGRIRNPADAAKLPNVDVIAAMPRLVRSSRGSGPSLKVAAVLPKSRRTRLLVNYQESIRILRNSLLFTAFDRPFRSLVVTAPRMNEDSSNVIANLAFSCAMLGRKVLVIDADLRDSSLHQIFETKPGPGLAEVISGSQPWRETLIRIAREELFLMPAGKMATETADLISTGMSGLLEEIYEDFDLVLLLAPPVLAAAESAPLSAAADAVLVMARAQFTMAEDITAAYSLLGRTHANIIGMVVNNVKHLKTTRLYIGTSAASVRAA